MKIKLFVTAVAAVLALNGCATSSSVPEPEVFTNSNSYALNIANQTQLTKYNSPLRDFTLEEVAEAENILERRTESVSAPKAIGLARILTGDLIGIIDVAGGIATDTVLSGHMAAYGRWIAAVPESEFSTPKDAQKYIIDRINKAQRNVVKQYFSDVRETVSNRSKNYRVLEVPLAGEGYLPVGAGVEINGPLWTQKAKSNLIDAKSAWVFGAEYGSGGVSVVSPLIMKIAGADAPHDEILKAVTAQLPKGFYLYVPSFPKSYIDKTQ